MTILRRLAGPSNRSGFTLVEILIVLGIVILLLGAGGFYLGDFQLNRRINSTASQITAMLKTAQERSASQQNDSRWGVYLDNPLAQTGSYILYMVDEDLVNGGASGVPGTTNEARKLLSGVGFSNPVAGSSANIIFARGTGLPNTSTTVSLILNTDTTVTRSIYISGNGHIEYR